MGKEVEGLEDHADLAAHLVDALDVRRELHAVDHDRAPLMLLEAVDAPDQRRLAGARRAADDDPLSTPDRQVDVAQRVKASVPFVDADEVDGGVALRRRRRHLRPFARLRSTNAEYRVMP